MNRQEKKDFVEDLQVRLLKAKATFLVEYQGLTVEDTDRLRGELRKSEAEFQVVKNRLLLLSSQGNETACMKDSMKGPSAIAISYGDVVGVAKTLSDFARDYKNLKIKAGQISGRPFGPDGVKRLADLPPRDVLLAQALSAMQGVPTSLVRVLNGVVQKLLYALKAIEQRKGECA
ncbi:MAG: 50S ribosomal protein L10 [Desulfobacteraceae bacterium]|jgi:large subunit ribosomal protein L10|nr:MAG: 50S ribosomal protein L10 [Desulfobacteraceae bacterium]